MISTLSNLKSNLLFYLLKIKKGEEKKFFSMALLMFTILLSQNIVRNIKDSWIVTLVGAQSIVFIKLLIETPFSVLFLIAYTKICNKVNLNWVFRLVIAFFIVYFCIFLFILMPNMQYIQLNPTTTIKYIKLYPHAKWFILLLSQWCIVSFYVMGEMVPLVVLPILFWQIPNNTSSIEQSKRFYPALSFFGQSNLIAISFLIRYLNPDSKILLYFAKIFHFEEEYTMRKIQLLLLIVVVLLILCIAFHKIIVNRLKKKKSQHKEYYSPLKLNSRETIKLAFSSKYALRIVLLVLCYSLSINLMEMLWFDKINSYYNCNMSHVMNYHAKVSFYTGISTLIFALLGSHIIAFLGWGVAAALTPLVLLITGLMFFVVITFMDHFYHLSEYFLTTNILLLTAVILCAIQTILSKGIKYSLFDSTKEMAYIPLPKELRTKGKAAFEIMSINLAKVLGSSVQSGIFIIFPYATCSDAKFILLILFVACISLWIHTVRRIGSQYNKYAVNHTNQTIK